MKRKFSMSLVLLTLLASLTSCGASERVFSLPTGDTVTISPAISAVKVSSEAPYTIAQGDKLLATVEFADPEYLDYWRSNGLKRTDGEKDGMSYYISQVPEDEATYSYWAVMSSEDILIILHTDTNMTDLVQAMNAVTFSVTKREVS